MISINKIREKSGLLLIIIGVALLAYILGDFFSSNQRSTTVNIGEINGEDIEVALFESMVEEQEEALKSVGQPVDEKTRDQIRNQVWNDLIRNKILGVELNDLGIDVAPEEYDDIRFGNNVLQDFKNDQTFINKESGQFDPNAVKQYFSYIQETYPLFWKNQRNRILETRKVNKYNTLIKKGLYANNLQAEFQYTAVNRKISINYVSAKYASIADSTITVADADLKSYFNAHKKEAKYKQVDSRSMEYVVFEVAPSSEDLQRGQKAINEIVEPFKTATNDSLFVVNNSDSRVFQAEVYAKGTTIPSIDTLLSTASVGTVVGPYENGKSLRLAKILSNGSVPEVNVRHILLKPTPGVEVAQLKVKADSILAAIKKNKNFAEVAQAISEDRGSAANGGDLNWFGKGAMVAPFDEASFAGAKGDFKIVETDFGVHILEIMDKRQTPQIKLAVIDRSTAPSKQTINEAYEKASNFSIKNDNIELFNKAVEADKLNKQIAPAITPQNKYIPGIENPDQLVRWVNNAEKGQVSEPFEFSDKFVVCVLTQVTKAGEPELDDVKDQMERELIKEKKAAMLAEKLKGNNLGAIATALNETVNNDLNLAFGADVIQNAGRELKVIGVAATLKKGEISKPIVGEAGVYKVQVVGITEAPKAANYVEQKSVLKGNYVNRVDYAAFNSLIEKSDVKDDRSKFY